MEAKIDFLEVFFKCFFRMRFGIDFGWIFGGSNLEKSRKSIVFTMVFVNFHKIDLSKNLKSMVPYWFHFIIQVGIRPDRRARGMLHISGGGSEWGVGQSGRGRWNVPPTWGNAGRGNVKNGGILGAVGYPRHPGSRSADFGCFF